MVKDMTPKQIDDLQTFANFGHDIAFVVSPAAGWAASGVCTMAGGALIAHVDLFRHDADGKKRASTC
jgi:hypothetical protein